MTKTTQVKLTKEKIVVSFKKVISDNEVHLEFIPINKYQLTCSKIIIENKSSLINIHSTDLRKINIHNLVKTSIKLIDKNIELDRKKYLKDNPIYNPELTSKTLIKKINMRKYEKREELLSMYALLYINIEREYGENISRKLADKIFYKESYLKNLTKECFKKGYLKNSIKGLPGGFLTSKSLKILNSL